MSIQALPGMTVTDSNSPLVGPDPTCMQCDSCQTLAVLCSPSGGGIACKPALGCSFLIASGAIELAREEEPFMPLGLQGRAALVGRQVVILHRICWPQHAHLLQTCSSTSKAGQTSQIPCVCTQCQKACSELLWAAQDKQSIFAIMHAAMLRAGPD